MDIKKYRKTSNKVSKRKVSKKKVSKKKTSKKMSVKKMSGGANKKTKNIDPKTNMMFKSDIEDQKCAPAKKYSEGSCFTLEALKDMSQAFNKFIADGKIKNKDKIKMSDSKRRLVEQLNDRLKDVCDDQLCWIKQDFVKYTKDKDDIKKLTFRPEGPQGRFTWLNTTNIEDIMDQYEELYSDFTFLGAVPMDFDDLPSLGIAKLNFDKLYNSGKHKVGVIFNTDESYKSGAHWIALFFDLNKFQIYFFDSYAKRPEKRVRKFVKRIAEWCVKKHTNMQIDADDSFMKPDKKNNIERLKQASILYNQNRKQFKNSECGVYSINFILRLLKGETITEIIGQALPDNKVNQCREVYFSFKNPDKKDYDNKRDDDQDDYEDSD